MEKYILNENSGKPKMAADFDVFLKSKEKRITFERMKVLDYIMGEELYFNADDLYLTMRTEKTQISRATIYNTLSLLCEAGLLVKNNTERKNSSALYTRV